MSAELNATAVRLRRVLDAASKAMDDTPAK